MADGDRVIVFRPASKEKLLMKRLKKYMTWIVLVAVLCMAANFDDREFLRNPIARYEVAQQTWISGNTDVLTPTLANLNGEIVQVEVDVAENTTNNITFTLAITTPDSGQVFSIAAIADNGATVFTALSDSTDFDAFVGANDTFTFTLTPSGDPGATGATVDVNVWLR